MKFNVFRVAAVIIILALLAAISYLVELNSTIKENNLLLKEEAVSLQRRMGELYAKKHSIEFELLTIKEEKEILVGMISKYETEKKELTTKIEDLKTNLASLNESISRREKEIEKLKKRLTLFAETPKEEKGAIELVPITVESEAERAALDAEVLDVNKAYDFVVINAGRNKGLRPEDTLFVFRGKRFLGRIAVERVGEDVSIARALYKSLRDVIRRGDRVSY